MAVLYTARRPTVRARAKRLLLATTNQTTVLTFTPARNMYLAVNAYLSVVTASTNVTLQVTWTDPDAGAQTYTWLNNQLINVGIQSEPTFFLLAKGGTSVNVVATASAANQVRVTCSIVEAE